MPALTEIFGDDSVLQFGGGTFWILLTKEIRLWAMVSSAPIKNRFLEWDIYGIPMNRIKPYSMLFL
jgi:hypothetical protein